MPSELMVKLVVGWAIQVVVILGGVWGYTMRLETRLTRLEVKMEVLLNGQRSVCKSQK